MKRVLFFLFAIAAFMFVDSSYVHAASVEVNVKDALSSEFKESHETYGALLSSSPELFNSGSVPYAARIKISVYNGSDELFLGWSKEESIMPGERKSFTIFAYTPSAGTFTVNFSAHYANSAFVQKEYRATFGNSQASRTITLSKPRVYENKITLDASSPSDENELVLLPVTYPPTWVFEQKEASIAKGKKARIAIPYDVDVFVERNISIIAVSKDGAFGEMTFPMKRKVGMSKYVSLFLDWIAGAK